MIAFSHGQCYRILNSRREDAGSYQCITSYDAGTIFSEKIDVIVACKWIRMNLRMARFPLRRQIVDYIDRFIHLSHSRWNSIKIFHTRQPYIIDSM